MPRPDAVTRPGALPDSGRVPSLNVCEKISRGPASSFVSATMGLPGTRRVGFGAPRGKYTQPAPGRFSSSRRDVATAIDPNVDNQPRRGRTRPEMRDETRHSLQVPCRGRECSRPDRSVAACTVSDWRRPSPGSALGARRRALDGDRVPALIPGAPNGEQDLRCQPGSPPLCGRHVRTKRLTVDRQHVVADGQVSPLGRYPGRYRVQCSPRAMLAMRYPPHVELPSTPDTPVGSQARDDIRRPSHRRATCPVRPGAPTAGPKTRTASSRARSAAGTAD